MRGEHLNAAHLRRYSRKKRNEMNNECALMLCNYNEIHGMLEMTQKLSTLFKIVLCSDKFYSRHFNNFLSLNGFIIIIILISFLS